MFYFFLILAVAGYAINQIITTALPRFFLVPTQFWMEKITKVMEYPKPIYLKVGYKRSSFRRRLVAASSEPSFYNNFTNNKLKLHPTDKQNEDDFFTSSMKHRNINDPRRKILFGFFHPYANNGGGGERVLWQAVKATLLANDNNVAVVYTVSTDQQPAHIINKVQEKFNIDLDAKRVVFIYLRRFGNLIDNNYWKHFTLIGQLFGSVLLSLEAMFELTPDIWVDTVGLPGSYLMVSKIVKIPICSYVHYPIIQEDMFNKLKFKSAKSDFLKLRSLSDIKQFGKLVYWDMLYYFYVYLGSLVDITLTNGTWTYNHMKNIWFLNESIGSTIEILYPPCGTELTEAPEFSKPRENKMIYIAQFRPEKRHDLILQEYAKFLKAFNKSKTPVKNLPTIIFLGSCRTDEDTDTLEKIKLLVSELQLSDYVEFVVDCSYNEILNQLSTVKYGLNSMWNEHFGIGVVEYLANGVIPLVHASAGPLLDITLNEGSNPVTDWKSDTGFFFKSQTDPDFNEQLQESDLSSEQFPRLKFVDNGEEIAYPEFCGLLVQLVLESPELVDDSKLVTMRQIGHKLVLEKFSNKAFVSSWMNHTRTLIGLEKQYREDKRDNIEGVH